MRSKGLDTFAAKWGEKIANKGLAAVPNCLLFCKSDLGLTDQELVTLTYLIARQFTPGAKPYVAITRMAKEIGKSRTAFSNTLRSLEKKGYIQREFRTNETNMYDLSGTKDILFSHDCIHNPINRKRAQWQKVARARYQKTDSKEKDHSIKNTNKKTTHSVGSILGYRNA